ncbi:hypothetical protein ACJMK2_000414 [Sinanodonta woodiana]|uniref:Uncharacterized protein n=1 Tax=Sinanodonta woodiana TaxID=1069815 RepID=A0ABD3XR37_SINWO
MGGKMIAFAILQILLLQVRYCNMNLKSTLNSGFWDVFGIIANVSLQKKHFIKTFFHSSIVIVGSVVGVLGVLALLIGFIVCYCHNPRAVMHHTNTEAHTVVLNNTGVVHGTPITHELPYGYPNGVAPPKDVTYDNLPQDSSIYSTIRLNIRRYCLF